MSKEEKKVIDVKEESKTFSINVSNGDNVFTLSGPEGSSFSEIESVAYKICTEMAILKWKENLRLEAEKNKKEDIKE